MTDRDEEKPGAAHITLDRRNLERLVDILALVPHDSEAFASLPAAYTQGWLGACDSMRRVAESMPELYGDDGWSEADDRLHKYDPDWRR